MRVFQHRPLAKSQWLEILRTFTKTLAIASSRGRLEPPATGINDRLLGGKDLGAVVRDGDGVLEVGR